MKCQKALMREIEEKRRELDEALRKGDQEECYARSLEFDRLVEQFYDLEKDEQNEENSINISV
jgi:hypothetical protein